ncbi:MAG: hypothetical protein UMU04_04345, partial [Halanaerobiales bacterium]|nr:hypothetical protein [Halanaerobiales bacterium]
MMIFYKLEKALESEIDRNDLFSVKIEKRIKQLKKTKLLQRELTQIEASAEKFMSAEIPSLSLKNFKLFFENGSRQEYERKYFQRREALSSLAVMSLFSQGAEKEKYLNYLAEVIWKICSEFTWALPAHLDWNNYNPEEISKAGVSSLKATHFADDFIEASKEVIDLFAAETAFALAEITYLLESELDSLVLSRVKSEILNRVLLPFSDLKNSYHWESLKMNWSAVCAASIGSAAIYLLKDNQELSRILKRVIDSFEVYLSSFAEDGVSREGPAYWNYGFSFYTYLAELLKKRTDN